MGNAGVKGKRAITVGQQINNKQIMKLNFISKALQGKAGELEKEFKAEKLKVRRAMERRDMKEARIHAENAVHKHKERTSYLQLSAQLDVVVDDLKAPFWNNTDGKSVGFILKSLKSYLAAGNLQKLSETMDQFERQVKSGWRKSYIDTYNDFGQARRVRCSDEDRGGWLAEPGIDSKASSFIATFQERRCSWDDHEGYNGVRGRRIDQQNAAVENKSEDSSRFAGEDIRSQQVANESGEEVNCLMQEIRLADESEKEVDRVMKEVRSEQVADKSDKEVDRVMKEVRSEQVADEFAKEVDRLMQGVADEFGLEM